MPRPGVPAIGPISLLIRRNNIPPIRLRSSHPQPNTPEQLWRTVSGSAFSYAAANWIGVSWYLEAYVRATSAKAMARLYDVTAGAEVADSIVTVNAGSSGVSSTPTRVRSSALTLVDGHEYRVQYGVQDGGAGEAVGAKLIAIG